MASASERLGHAPQQTILHAPLAKPHVLKGNVRGTDRDPWVAQALQ
jgi:hypothetical protein